MISFLAFFLNAYFLLALGGFLLWWFCTFTYGFWKRLDIKYKEPVPFFGNSVKFAFMLQSFHECIHDLYMYFCDEPYGGFFQMREPTLLLRDADLVHTVLVKDFKNFVNRGMEMINPDKELNPLALHLFASEGEEWRSLRRKISPIFTSGKLKSMHAQIAECVEKLNSLVEKDMQHNSLDANLKGMYECLTIDVIGSCAFGIECNSLNSNNQFRIMGHKVLQPTWVTSVRFFVSVISKRLLKRLRLPDIPTEAKNFFLDLVLDTMRYRRSNNIHRGDLLQLLMGLQNAYEDPQNAPDDGSLKKLALTEDRFDEIHVAANSFLFFIAGFETTASTLSYCLYELAINEAIQNRLREEVTSAYNKNNQNLDVDTLREIPYLDAVLTETLRKYPPLPWLIRRVEEDWTIPNTKKVLKKGTKVIIPIWSIHHDWRYYPNPEAFDPERFYGENISKIRNGTYIPFGDGPRNCVGARFAKIEMRLALADAVLKYQFSPCSKTRIPLNYVKGSVMLNSKDGIWVNISKRDLM